MTSKDPFSGLKTILVAILVIGATSMLAYAMFRVMDMLKGVQTP